MFNCKDLRNRASVLGNEGQTGESGHSVTFDPEVGLAMTPDGGVNEAASEPSTTRSWADRVSGKSSGILNRKW